MRLEKWLCLVNDWLVILHLRRFGFNAASWRFHLWKRWNRCRPCRSYPNAATSTRGQMWGMKSVNYPPNLMMMMEKAYQKVPHWHRQKLVLFLTLTCQRFVAKTVSISVFFNVLSEAEPFAAILIAHRTHFFWGAPEAQRAEIGGWRPRMGDRMGSLGGGSKPAAGFGAEPRPWIHFGPTKSLASVSSGRKCRMQNPWIPWWNPGWKLLL